MSLVLDAGGLIAVERGDRDAIALIKRERLSDRAPITHGGGVGPVWRGGPGRQALSPACCQASRSSHSTKISDDAQAFFWAPRAAPTSSTPRSSSSHAMTTKVLTSDPRDLIELARAAGVQIELNPV